MYYLYVACHRHAVNTVPLNLTAHHLSTSRLGVMCFEMFPWNVFVRSVEVFAMCVSNIHKTASFIMWLRSSFIMTSPSSSFGAVWLKVKVQILLPWLIGLCVSCLRVSCFSNLYKEGYAVWNQGCFSVQLGLELVGLLRICWKTVDSKAWVKFSFCIY